MANSTQIISLIKSHLEGDDSRFRSLALQIAASEAKAGHAVCARSINELLSQKRLVVMRSRLQLLNKDVATYLIETECPYRISDLIVREDLKEKVKRVIFEYIQRERLHEYNLENRHRILMVGPSGTGKTMTASVIANELSLPLYVVRMEKVLTKFMGETSMKLGQIFDFIQEERAVYLFDEFDAIGQKRGRELEVGEMRRVLNSFLQMMEREYPDSLILTATNDPKSLDDALFRRFDDILEYTLPSDQEKLEIIRSRLASYHIEGDLSTLLPNLKGRSHAEVCMICNDAAKESILKQRSLNVALFKEVCAERVFSYSAI